MLIYESKAHGALCFIFFRKAKVACVFVDKLR